MANRNQEQRLPSGDPRLIMRWARRYAKSRTISFLVQWVFIVIMVFAVGVAAALTNMAYQAQHMGLFALSVAAMVLAILGLTWFSVSQWGSEIVWRLTQWLYGQEGYASAQEDEDRPTPWWIMILGGGLVVYHLVGALLISFNYLPLKYMQPFSALYMSPFLIIMILYQGLGFWAWVWPILYAVHAVLALFGINVFGFTGDFQLLNMVVAVFGYGLIAILAGHLYSRFALRRLKSLARSGLDSGSDEEEEYSSGGVGGS